MQRWRRPRAASPRSWRTLPPTPGQRRMARAFLLALLVILLGTWPFAAIKLPEVDAFVPTLAAALFVSDCVTAALLFAQFSILRQWALLVIASGYVFSGSDRGCTCAGVSGSVHADRRPRLGIAIRRLALLVLACRAAPRHHRLCAAQRHGSCGRRPLHATLPSA